MASPRSKPVDIERLCPFVADAFLWQPTLGEHRLTVCVKATFALIQGRNADIAAHQIPLHEDLPWEAQNPSSLYASSDYVPKKQRIDILLTGHAHAPAGNPAASLTARLQVGTFTKSLQITGDRTWTPTREGLRPSSARPFVSMPLRYERAALGPGNPIGIDASQGAALAGRPLPNIQLLDQNGAQQGVPGFGPVPATVRARRLRMNDGLIKWARLFRSEATPPSIDFDFAFFNAAPPDQQLDTLPEPLDIVLENLHPSIARFSSRIPGIGLRAFRVSPKTGLSYALPLLLDTVLIDSDRSLAILSFRGNTAVNTSDERALGKLVITTADTPQTGADTVFAGPDSSLPSLSRPSEQNATQPPQKTPPPAAKRDRGTVPLPPALSAQVPPRARAGVGETTINTRKNPIDSLKNSNALPKSWTVPLPPSPSSPSPPVNTIKNQANSIINRPDPDEVGSTTLDSSIPSKGIERALPFVSPPPQSPAPAYSASLSGHRAPVADPDEVGSTTLAAPGPSAPSPSILPFGRPLGTAAAPSIESALRTASPPPPRSTEISGTLPLGMRTPPQLSSGLPFQTRAETPPKPPVFNALPPEPPPFVPPPRSSQPGLSPPPPAVVPPPPRSSQPGLSPPPPAAVPPPLMSVEQCASVAAELGARFSPRTEVLRKYQLDEAAFGEAERHWMNAIASESEAGKSELLELFDERYVQVLEQLRGEITVEMYAQLMVGSERGNLRPALAELKLQRPAVLRIERVWKRRLSRDAKLAASAADAIALERKK